MTPDAAARLGFIETPIAHAVLQHRRVVECNAALERLFGYRRSELLGVSVALLYPSQVDFTKIGERGMAQLGETGFYEDERFMRDKGGNIFWTHVSGQTLTRDDPHALTVWSFQRAASGTVPQALLTPREKEIANHVVNGLTSREIGQLLSISSRTVEVHRAQLMRKLGARNTAELISQTLQTR